MSEIGRFLRNVPVLMGLADAQLDRLGEQVAVRQVRAGEWIFRQGDVADRMYIVRSGRVEVIAEEHGEDLIRVLRRGGVLGELALLREGSRSASARARRDTELLELRREEFESLILGAPGFALGLTRAMGAQLAESHTPLVKAAPPRTIAVVGLSRSVPAREAAEALAEALRAYGSVGLLTGGELATIDNAEHEHERLVLAAPAMPGDAWTDTALRESDLVIAISDTVFDPAWQAHAQALRGCELLVRAKRAPDHLLSVLRPGEVQVIADGVRMGDVLQATARRLAGKATGIVFSGGGARALAHLGVYEELTAAGLHFDRVAGVSAGSLVAAAIASGFSVEEIYDLFEQGFVLTNPSSDYILPAFSLVRGVKARRLLAGAFGERRIEELPLRFFCLSCDLIAREAVVHRTGPLVDAVFASLAIPGVFPPVATPDGRLLVDGGVIDNLPVATMAASGEGPVVAVDVTGRMGDFRRPGRPGVRALGAPVRRFLTGSDAQIPRIGETIVRTVTVGSSDTVAAARLNAELVITPRSEGIGLMEWKALPRVRELGRRAAQQVLEASPDIVRRLHG